ncbi:hypothetical protein PPL_06556 [Heterostelium album PN500]|uniref:Uncharacterized protein n=1 Tax=Heterostelium pallidum (strain ATCC 26659 / Pp 5 / PN500) TaxID=670386 RepID=D3BDH3_HETP5|nr:hypothetical protein PPL_06556 [Heterostelium album PN500]EFA80617.1 hypothetical protein PPL_06556 [Heterostelium album PN500]|eukprot:XP_020432737.1 hypothetical protein PPL_06556 [Heterostelium album PN500]
MIVNLSHLLLLKIVNYLEDNIDRICVTLKEIRFSIHLAEYDIDEIFKDRSQYHLETLSVNANKQEGYRLRQSKDQRTDWNFKHINFLCEIFHFVWSL